MNLTQVEFAKLLSVSQGTISDIESFKTAPSSDTIAAIQGISKTLCLNWLYQNDNDDKEDALSFPDQCNKIQSNLLKPIDNAGYHVTSVLNGGSIIARAKLEQAAKEIINSQQDETAPSKRALSTELTTELIQRHK